MNNANPKVRIVSIDKLVLDDQNPNKHTKRGRALIEKSLKKYGAGRSVLVDKNMRVIAGNATVEQARAAGIKRIAVIEGDGSVLVAHRRGDLDLKTDNAARELSIADNRASELDLGWDAETLAGLKVDLTDFWNESELRKVLGDFAPPEAEAPEPKLDKAAELQKKWKTARGQIWEIGKHQLRCEDVTTIEPFVGAALMVTDPPYGVDYGSLVSSRKNQKKGGWTDISGDALSNEDLSKLLVAAFAQCKAPVAFVWHPAGARRFLFWDALQKCGWTVSQEIVWVKNSMVFGRADYQWRHEPCLYAKREGAPRQDDRTQTTVWELNKPHDSQHPTQKPVELFAIPIRNHTKKGDLVFDPFCGSGTLICAAQLTGRTGVGIELEPKYVAVALERLSEMGLKPKLTKG